MTHAQSPTQKRNRFQRLLSNYKTGARQILNVFVTDEQVYWFHRGGNKAYVTLHAMVRARLRKGPDDVLTDPSAEDLHKIASGDIVPADVDLTGPEFQVQ